MWQYAAKVFITVAVVVAVSEIGKRSSLWGAVLVSLPLTSLLAYVWLYLDTESSERIAALSQSIFWLVLASLPALSRSACHVALGRFVLVQSRGRVSGYCGRILWSGVGPREGRCALVANWHLTRRSRGTPMSSLRSPMCAP